MEKLRTPLTLEVQAEAIWEQGAHGQGLRLARIEVRECAVIDVPPGDFPLIAPGSETVH